MKTVRPILITFLVLLLAGCGGTRDPVVEMQRSLSSAPDYTIILEDMRAEEGLFPKYYHRYRVVQGEKQVETNWVDVQEEIYRKYEPFLGMALASKTESEVTNSPHPPGYNYVGNPTYGHWGGGGFWVWYGQYSMMRSLMGGGMGRQIYRNEWDDYRSHRTSQRPYYGKNKDFGTNGSLTKQSKPAFYQRRQRSLARQRSGFGQRVNNRIGRSRTGFGSRGGGFGK